MNPSSLSNNMPHTFYPFPSSNVRMTTAFSFVDIGANLLDGMYQGNYRGKQRHPKDLDTVLQRAWDNHVDGIIITAGTIHESQQAQTFLDTATANTTNTATTIGHDKKRLFCTAGVHPTRCLQEFGNTQESWKEALQNLKKIIQEGMEKQQVVALGELGLDYARLEFCDAETQRKGLIAQLELARENSFDLPLFLHNRESGQDLWNILKEHYFFNTISDRQQGRGGVVHSFDDTLEMAHKFMDLGLYIGLNGCSLKTEENLKVVKDIPLNRIMLETDCPWCDIRPTHAGWKYVRTQFDTRTEKKYDASCCVKGRYEPCHIVQVAEVVAGVKGVTLDEVAHASSKNVYDLFGISF